MYLTNNYQIALPMGKFTTSLENDSNNIVNIKPKNTTLELIRQYARVCTALPTTTLALLITN